MAKIMGHNNGYKGTDSSESPKTNLISKPKPRKFQNTELVSRESNYKQCELCSLILCLNMTDHILKTHKISKKYEKWPQRIR